MGGWGLRWYIWTILKNALFKVNTKVYQLKEKLAEIQHGSDMIVDGKKKSFFVHNTLFSKLVLIGF
jgi:hypothetical protein